MESQQLQKVASDVGEVVVNNTISSVAPQGPALVQDSALDIFINAGFIIKFVILSLFLSSIWSWTIIISKHMKLKRLKNEADVFEDHFWSGSSLEEMYHELKNAAFDPLSNVFCAAMAEWERITKRSKGVSESNTSSIQQKVNRVAQIKQLMQITINKEVDDIEKNMTFLSTLGTNGVIVGILGMVVGIMDGMKTIAIHQSAGMAAVAPIISEALFTTALGLFAAIPAAIAYNKLSSDISRYVNRLETFSDEFSSIISRQLDEH